MTARPLRQGGLATQQADSIATAIAAWSGAPVTPRPYRPVPRAVLLIGGVPLFLRRGSAEPYLEAHAELLRERVTRV